MASSSSQDSAALLGQRAVGIVGGMGPAAGADFLRLFLDACTLTIARSGRPLRDQSYPEHWLAQVPVPDRQEIQPGGPTPQGRILETLGRMQSAGIRTVAIACNTAHAWHGEFERALPTLEILHIAREAMVALARDGARRVGVMATLGTHQSLIYESAGSACGIECFAPPEHDQALVMRGVFEGVKKGNFGLGKQCFEAVARRLIESQRLDAVLCACTEIPLAVGADQIDSVPYVNPAQALAVALAQRALGALPQ